jgi:hypothetical protein
MVKLSNISSLLLATVLFGLFSFGSTNAYKSFNPSEADLKEALRSNQTPESRSINGPEPALTNAQRFARNLPPAPPASIPREHSLHFSHESVAHRTTVVVSRDHSWLLLNSSIGPAFSSYLLLRTYTGLRRSVRLDAPPIIQRRRTGSKSISFHPSHAHLLSHPPSHMCLSASAYI